jgi:methyl-accepting chemotaxis protein
MDTMQQGLRDFIAAQSHMARQHELGEIDHRIPAEQFPGTYGEMARSVNELVDSHIDLNYRMAEVIKHYAVGDFSVEMPALPGKKAQLAEVCSEAKHNLVGMQEQILQLSEAAARGDFSVRGDADRFENAYRDMVTKLNQLMEVCDSSLSDVARVLSAIAKGDLTETIVTDYAGTFGQLKRDSNLTVEQLLSIVSKIQQASEAINAAASEIMAGNSDLSRRTEDQAAGRGFLQRGMEELTATVLQNAESAHQANQLAMRASDVALKGHCRQPSRLHYALDRAELKEIFDIISVMEVLPSRPKSSR